MSWQRVTGCSEADDNASGERVTVTATWGGPDHIRRGFLHNLTNLFKHVFACQDRFLARLKNFQK